MVHPSYALRYDVMKCPQNVSKEKYNFVVTMMRRRRWKTREI